MKKRILIISLCLVFLAACAIIYVNTVILPVRIKSLLINTLREQTQKEVSIGRLEFNIFRGLFLEGLKIYDDKGTIISLKEASCAFVIPPIFKRTLIIPFIKLKSAEIFLERRPDNTFNLADLFSAKKKLPGESGFKLLVYKIKVSGAQVNFKDNTLTPEFNKTIDNIDLTFWLSLPAAVKFHLKTKAQIPSLLKIEAAGAYRIGEKQLAAKISLQDNAPQEFLPYYRALGIEIARGSTAILADLKLQNNILEITLAAQNKGLNIAKENILLTLNAETKASIRYLLENKQLEFSGTSSVHDTRISGLKFVGDIESVEADIAFNNAGLSCDKLKAIVLGLPVIAKVRLENFTSPLLDIDAVSSVDLVLLKGILKDRLQFAILADIQGTGNLFVGVKNALAVGEPAKISGYLDLINTSVKLEKLKYPIEDIQGRIEFDPLQIKWPQLNFTYQGTAYKTIGALTDFAAPQVSLGLYSPQLSLDSAFSINNKMVQLSRCQGKYLNSQFFARGTIDIAKPLETPMDINAELNLDLQDLKEAFKESRGKIEKMRLQGAIGVQCSVKGNINDFKSCSIQAKALSPAVSAYGLQLKDFLLDYNQAGGLVDIPVMHCSLYGGAVDAIAKMNLNSQNLPYTIDINISAVKLEELKLDTPAKDKDIAGLIQAQAKLNGFSNDISRLSGTGQISISGGKLWQLDLFKGLGALVFAQDFANIIFHEGYCGFIVQDKSVSTDNLKLKSSIAELSGSARIGFDSSIDAALNVEILDEGVPLSGTFKDITTVILGQGSKFGVIKISGTLQQPKYKFKPAVVNIIQGIQKIFFNK